jgi:hypothetical protein
MTKKQKQATETKAKTKTKTKNANQESALEVSNTDITEGSTSYITQEQSRQLVKKACLPPNIFEIIFVTDSRQEKTNGTSASTLPASFEQKHPDGMSNTLCNTVAHSHPNWEHSAHIEKKTELPQTFFEKALATKKKASNKQHDASASTRDFRLSIC